MAIVSKLPFEIKFLCPYQRERHCINFATKLSDIYEANIVTAEIEENEEVYIRFDCRDSDARLYLEAFDIIPAGYGILSDEQGNLYKKPSQLPFPLYQNGNLFDALCVDKFIMKVVCYGEEYYGILSIKPKQLENNEWNQMRNELEKEMKNLAKQAMRKRSFDSDKDLFTKEEWNCLEVVNNHKRWLLAVLQDIMEKPKYKIITNYVKVKVEGAPLPLAVSEHTGGYGMGGKSGFQPKSDRKTIQYQMQTGRANIQLLPSKEISYDIAENQFLRMVVRICRKRLRGALGKIKKLLSKKTVFLDTDRLLEYYQSGMSVYKSMEILEMQKWFGSVHEFSNRRLSSALFLDDRYGYIYKFYARLCKTKEVEVDFLSYTFTWKPSSVLYEMWCYIKLCREFEKEWQKTLHHIEGCFTEEDGMPALRQGCFVEYRKENKKVKIFYNPKLPQSSYESSMYGQPYYMLNSHVQPDIVIHMFYDDGQEQEIYMGSLVLECKYRKVNSFWNGSTMSSRSQIIDYWAGSKSKYYMGKLGQMIDVRPVKKVLVLTPERVVEEKYEGEILLVSMHPGDRVWVERLYDEIERNMEECNNIRKQINTIF